MAMLRRRRLSVGASIVFILGPKKYEVDGVMVMLPMSHVVAVVVLF